MRFSNDSKVGWKDDNGIFGQVCTFTMVRYSDNSHAWHYILNDGTGKRAEVAVPEKIHGWVGADAVQIYIESKSYSKKVMNFFAKFDILETDQKKRAGSCILMPVQTQT